MIGVVEWDDSGELVYNKHVPNFFQAGLELRILDASGLISERMWDAYEQVGMALNHLTYAFDPAELRTCINTGSLMIYLNRTFADARGTFQLIFRPMTVKIDVWSYMRMDESAEYDALPIRELVGAIAGIHIR